MNKNRINKEKHWIKIEKFVDKNENAKFGCKNCENQKKQVLSGKT